MESQNYSRAMYCYKNIAQAMLSQSEAILELCENEHPALDDLEKVGKLFYVIRKLTMASYTLNGIVDTMRD